LKIAKNVVTDGIGENVQKPGHDNLNYFFLLFSTVYKKPWLITVGVCFTLVAGVIYADRTTVRKRPHQRRQVPWSHFRRGEEKILQKFASTRLYRQPHHHPCLRGSSRLRAHGRKV